MPTLDAVLTQLHSLSDQEKGLRFERLCVWLLESEPTFAVRRAYRWQEWRERRLARDGVDVGGDIGIDIVAETDDGQPWAVQAKCYRPDSRVSTDDIDSFIACAATSEFSHLLLIATTDQLAPVGLRKLLGARNPGASALRLEDLRELERDDWPAVAQNIRRAVRRPQKMRAHQIAAAADVAMRGFGVTPGQRCASPGPDRGQLLMACGTGKTLTSQRIAEKLRSQRTLVVVPTLSLLEQTLRAWKRNAARRFDAFCFCSDPTVAGRRDDDSDRDVDTVAAPVHTDPERLRAFLATGGRQVVFATYQSLASLTEVFAWGEPADPFDLLIADEAHRSSGRAGSPFGLVCDSVRLPAARRLFMTATARVVTGPARDDLVLSMDDPARYGPVFHRLSFTDAVEQDLLCDYQVLVIAADPGEHQKLVKARRLVSTPEHEVVAADALAVQLAVLRAMKRDGLRRLLSFHSRVKGASTFARDLVATARWRGVADGTLWTQSVSGHMPAGHRRVLLRRLERLDGCERGLLANARCLGEGVDVPAIDAVVFVDPRESVIDIVQAVGRTMRKSPQTGKKRGTVIVPVVVDTDDADTALASSSFGTVWKVLGALRAHDDRLDDELVAMVSARARGRFTGASVPRVSFELPTIALDSRFAAAFSVKVVQVTSYSFDVGLAEFAAHVDAGGDPRTRRQYVTPTGFALGIWVHARRNDRRAGKLSDERVAQLDALGFVWKPLQHTFDRGLAELGDYVRSRGDTRVPSGYVTPTGFELGVWCQVRRTMRKSGQLSDERVAALDALGFIWDQLQHDFERGLAHLAAYVRTHGDARVPQGYVTSTGYQLGTWCGERRKQYRAGRLPEDRVNVLQALGFDWDPARTAYERGLAELRAYVAAQHHARVPDGYRSAAGFGLAKWATLRRSERRLGRLDAARVAELDALGFVWDPLAEDFARGLAELDAYAAAHGTAKVPHKHVTATGFTLGRWCGMLRQSRKAGKISDERRVALDALGFVWAPHQDRFDLGMSELTEYVGLHGSADVPRGYRSPTGFALARWCERQRAEHRRGALGPDRVASLQALGFAFEPGREDPFDTGFAHLHAYVSTHSDAKVPAGYRTPAGFALGTWCNLRRQDRRAGRLSDERVGRLDALGFVWAPHEAAFDRGLAELAAYVQRTGTTRVPRSHRTATGFGLGLWLAAREKELREGRPGADRARKLASLGVVAAPVRDSFERGMAELHDYVPAHDHARVPASYRSPTGFALGKWCSHRRDDRKQGRLAPVRVRALDEVGFVWDLIQDGYATGLRELAAYRDEHEHARVPQHCVTATGFKLGAWCSERRTDRRLGRLAADRQEQLDSLGFVWSVFEERFARSVAELAVYVAEHGDACVPQHYATPTGFRLGAWVSARRADYHRGLLAPERVAELNTLGFIWAVQQPRRRARISTAPHKTRALR